MFRLIATNSLTGLRPALLRNVRSNTGGLKLSGQNRDFDKFRNNSTSAPVARADNFFARAQQDPLLKDLVPQGRGKVNHFEELLHLTNVSRSQRPVKPSVAESSKHYERVRRLYDIFCDESVKAQLSEKNILQYVNIINTSVYENRVLRLSSLKNRDSDSYKSETLAHDLLLKSAVLDLANCVLHGQFKEVFNPRILRQIFLAMAQFKAFDEMINLWEAGVNGDDTSTMYLQPNVLSVILPVAYDEGKLTYDQIVQIYEANCKKPHDDALCAMGKIAIRAGDYSRALDSLELMLQIYERYRDKKQTNLMKSLGELHLSFIGSCKDMRIAKHFFDKVIEGDLPYHVVLKAPHVRSLLENCAELDSSFDSLVYFWRASLDVYDQQDRKHQVLNSRYAIVNNAFFSIFYKKYPQLTEESYGRLKEVIAIYANTKPLDEFFLNTIISNYTWGDKVVFEQLVDNFKIHGVAMTPVAHRIILKKLGEISGAGNEEILARWNESLACVDGEGYKYIPIADWAALRDATILSAHADERSDFYLAVLDKYKNYHQDERAVMRFCKFWLKKDDYVKQVARVTKEEAPVFDTDIAIDVPRFANLRENVNYKAESAKVLSGLV